MDITQKIYDMNLAELQKYCHQISVSKGFWDEHDNATDPGHKRALVSEKLALIHSEATEALEELRNGKSYTGNSAWEYDENGKVVGFGSELADIIIRVLDLAEGLKTDLTTITGHKLKYNAEHRGKLHGKKF